MILGTENCSVERRRAERVTIHQEMIGMKTDHRGSWFARRAALVALALLATFAASCNTVKGIGEDVSAAGQGLADVAAKSTD